VINVHDNHITLKLHSFSGRYVEYHLEGVIYNSDTKYIGLVDAIADQLGIDTIVDELNIMYLVSDRSPPMSIHNDMGVHVYLDQRRVNVDFFSKYPLCITLKKRAMVEDEYGPIIERTNNVVGEISGVSDLYSNNSVRLIGMNPIEYIDTVDDEENDIISDASDLSVDVKQVYKDKSVLGEVMKHYAFVNKFTFNVKRSSSTW